LYSAIVARELLFHPHSVYASFYEFHRSVVPHWGALILLNVILSFVGLDLAQKVLMSFCIVVGFFCFSYCARSIAPTFSPWTPIANFVLQNWLLWTGFYDFYLGTMLGLLVVGSYIRHVNGISVRRAVAFSIALTGIFFMHLMAAALTAFALMTVAGWVFVVAPVLIRSGVSADSPRLRSGLRHVGLVAAMLLPVAILFAFFAWASWRPILVQTTTAEALIHFQAYLFTTAAGPFGNQIYLWPAVLGYIAVAIVMLQRSEWAMPLGGLAVAALLSFLVYLVVPEAGFGGGAAKIRFLWAIFVFGGLVAISVQRLQPVRIPFALFVAGLMLANLTVTTRSVRAYSAAIEDYLSALDEFPPGSRIIRLRYPTPNIPERYGYYELERDPLISLDGYAAARCLCIDLSEHQAASRIFPIIFNATIDRIKPAEWLANFRAPDRHTSELVGGLLGNWPGPPDYVIVIVDRLSEHERFDPPRGFLEVLATLNDFGMQITSRSRTSQFVRVYKRTENP
jgi:hypothetical protein